MGRAVWDIVIVHHQQPRLHAHRPAAAVDPRAPRPARPDPDRLRPRDQPDRDRDPDRVGLPGDLPAAPPEQAIRERDPSPSPKAVFVISWAGMRGAVSLAAALALPIDVRFPQRDLVIFLTFCVILATLVGQGLTLPALIRRLGLVGRHRAGHGGVPRPAGRGRRGARPADRSRGRVPGPSRAGRPARGPGTSTRRATSGRTATGRATRTSRSGSTTSRSGPPSSTPSARRSSGCATTGSSATRCCTASSATSTSRRCGAASDGGREGRPWLARRLSC